MNSLSVLKLQLETIEYVGADSISELDKLLVTIIDNVEQLENLHSEVLSKEQLIMHLQACRTKEITWLPEKTDVNEVLFDARKRVAKAYLNGLTLNLRGNKIFL